MARTRSKRRTRHRSALKRRTKCHPRRRTKQTRKYTRKMKTPRKTVKHRKRVAKTRKRKYGGMQQAPAQASAQASVPASVPEPEAAPAPAAGAASGAEEGPDLTLSPVRKKGPGELNIKELIEYVNKGMPGKIRDIQENKGVSPLSPESPGGRAPRSEPVLEKSTPRRREDVGGDSLTRFDKDSPVSAASSTDDQSEEAFKEVLQLIESSDNKSFPSYQELDTLKLSLSPESTLYNRLRTPPSTPTPDGAIEAAGDQMRGHLEDTPTPVDISQFPPGKAYKLVLENGEEWNHINQRLKGNIVFMVAAIHSKPQMYHEIKRLPEYTELTLGKQTMLTKYYENIIAKQTNPSFQGNIERTSSTESGEGGIEHTSSAPTHGGYANPIEYVLTSIQSTLTSSSPEVGKE